MLTSFRRTFALTFLLTSSLITTASAGIIDTDRDSFIDDTTGLEWLDINMTTNKTYDYVISNLGQGQEYEGWRLPTFNEVFSMMNTSLFSIADRIITDTRTQYSYAKNVGDINAQPQIGESNFDNALEAMGYGKKQTQANGYLHILTQALFTDEQGDLAVISSENSYFRGDEDIVTITMNSPGVFEHRILEEIEWSGTLLVKGTSTPTSTQVSEPASIFVFSLGIMALAVRRFSQAKTALIK